ncbi:MAG: pilus assembly protein [Firmicutes bacterium]|nr:pilus assembly protein [Bacillota bacterium]MBQ9972942.1 pilus assembly protein [Bacillota bacterium]
MKAGERKGSVMVEAAIVFPIMIFTLLTIMYITINLYSEVVVNTRLHLTLASEAGSISNTVSYSDDSIKSFDEAWLIDSGVDTERENTIVSDIVKGYAEFPVISKGLVITDKSKSCSITKDIIDEEEYLRCIHTISGAVSAVL